MANQHGWSWLAVSSLLFSSLGCATAPDHLAGTDSELTYSVVTQDIEKYVGKRVAWDGITLGYHALRQDGKMIGFESYTYLPADDKSGGVDFEKPFTFSRLDTEDFSTPAAKKAKEKHRRVIIGTIAGSKEMSFTEGTVTKKIMAPVFKDVIVDVRARK